MPPNFNFLGKEVKKEKNKKNDAKQIWPVEESVDPKTCNVSFNIRAEANHKSDKKDVPKTEEE